MTIELTDLLYYTFSTIPQVLAAMVALLGVFWAYKMGDYDREYKAQVELFLGEIEGCIDAQYWNWL